MTRQTEYRHERPEQQKWVMMRAGVAGIIVASCIAAWAQAPASAPTPASAPSSTGAPAQSPAIAPQPSIFSCSGARGCSRRPPHPLPSATVAGGKLHGTVKSGNIPLPGVTVTAQNTLTGKRYSTTTDITGAWQMNIPQNGRYVIRTQFAAFAQGSQEAVLNATSHDQLVNFQLILASRQTEQTSSKRKRRGRAHTKAAALAARARACGKWPATLRKT